MLTEDLYHTDQPYSLMNNVIIATRIISLWLRRYHLT